MPEMLFVKMINADIGAQQTLSEIVEGSSTLVAAVATDNNINPAEPVTTNTVDPDSVPSKMDVVDPVDLKKTDFRKVLRWQKRIAKLRGTVPDDVTYSSSMLQTLHDYQRAELMCDAVIVAEDGQLRAHSAVLAAASPAFRAGLEACDDRSERVVVLPGVQLSVAQIIVHLAYTGHLVVPPELDTDVESIANTLAELDMKLPASRMKMKLSTHPSVAKRKKPDDWKVRHTNPTVELKEAVSSVNTSVFDIDVDNVSSGRGSMRESARRARAFLRTITNTEVSPDVNANNDSSTDSCDAKLDHRSTSLPRAPRLCSVPKVKPVSRISEIKSVKKEKRPKGMKVFGLCTLPREEGHAASLSSGNGVRTSLRGVVGNRKERYGRRLCEICGKLMNNLTTYSIHMAKHAGIKSVTCPKCSVSVTDRYTLRSHLYRVHSEKKFACTLCSKRFALKGELNNHYLSRHKVSPPGMPPAIPCPQCPLLFLYQSKLRRHMLVHTGERPYACNYCSRTFAVNHRLQEHLNEHTGEKPYRCIECNTSYAYPSSYYSHLSKTHGHGQYAPENGGAHEKSVGEMAAAGDAYDNGVQDAASTACVIFESSAAMPHVNSSANALLAAYMPTLFAVGLPNADSIAYSAGTLDPSGVYDGAAQNNDVYNLNTINMQQVVGVGEGDCISVQNNTAGSDFYDKCLV